MRECSAGDLGDSGVKRRLTVRWAVLDRAQVTGLPQRQEILNLYNAATGEDISIRTVLHACSRKLPSRRAVFDLGQ